MWSRAELKANAKLALKPNYWKAVLVSLLTVLIFGGSTGAASTPTTQSNAADSFMASLQQVSTQTGAAMITVLGVAIAILGAVLLVSVLLSLLFSLILNPIQVGFDRFFIDCKNGNPGVVESVSACKGHWFHVGWIILLMHIFIGLWSCLLVIPGVIKSYEYQMVPYILAENPDMDRKAVFARSKEMMKGNKWNAFILDLSFLGWVILSVFTLGLLMVFYVNPYIQLTKAELYHTLKNAN